MTASPRPSRRRPRAQRPALALALIVSLIAAAGCGSGGGSGTAGSGVPNGQSKQQGSRFAGAEALPPKPAPPLALTDSVGQRIDLTQFRGKAVLVTFIYTHCPDVCPLIAGNLHAALGLLGSKAGEVQILAVSTDPRGDNPRTVAAFLKKHQMTGRMDYLIGSRPQLERVWKDWNIVSRPSKAGRDLVEHSALVYGISASGKITTLYPSNFRPQDIAHDVPLLAAQ